MVIRIVWTRVVSMLLLLYKKYDKTTEEVINDSVIK